MAFSTGPAATSGRRGRRALPGAMAEINIIPLVDVVLVLLIIFMLTAHVMEFGLEINVPKVSTQPKSTTEELPVVSVTKNGDVQLNEKIVNIAVLQQEFRKRFPNATAVYVRADKDTVWDVLAKVVAVLGQRPPDKEKGLDVRLVTQPMGGSGRR
ncbi:MAG: biopolymer transporter ExbD [Bryobacteraceae bacterium]